MFATKSPALLRRISLRRQDSLISVDDIDMTCVQVRPLNATSSRIGCADQGPVLLVSLATRIILAASGQGNRRRYSLLFALCVLLAGPVTLRAAAVTVPLTSARQVHELGADQAIQALPVHLVATVTYYQPGEENLFVADASGGVFVLSAQTTAVHAGDLVDIWGVTRKSLKTVVLVTQPIRVLSHNHSLTSRSVDFRSFLAGVVDCQVVTIRGIVRSASLERHGTDVIAQLQLLMPGGLVQSYIQDFNGMDLEALIDSDVELTGVAGAAFNAVGEVMRPRLLANNAHYLKILNRPIVKPWNVPLTDIRQLEQSRYVENRSRRVRVQGAVTASDPGYSMVIQNGSGSLFVMTRQADPVPLGAIVDVIGFPDDHAYAAVLESAEFRLTGRQELIVPKAISYAEAISGAYSDRLVTLRGTVSSELHGELSDAMVIIVDQHAVELVLRHEGRHPLPDLRPGTVVTAEGICRVTPSIEWKTPLLFRLDLREGDDLTIVNRPSWWNVQRLFMLVAALAVLVSIILFWVAFLRRKVHKQTDQLRQSMFIEQERSRLLEQINSDLDLESLLRDICRSMNLLVPMANCSIRPRMTDSTSSEHLADARERARKRFGYSKDLLNRHGELMGSFRADLPDDLLSREEARKILTSGADLATVAINQRKVFADLNHTSTHDQLTGLPNRRLCDTTLAHALTHAKSTGKKVGVAYIDIDRFKQVNDRFGHKVGDLYLQALAERFQSARSPGDMLARVGGDEFILIAPELNSVEAAEEYKHRFDLCFGYPFECEQFEFVGSASVGFSVFPDDGGTPEELKRFADAQMYKAKRTTSRSNQEPAA